MSIPGQRGGRLKGQKNKKTLQRERIVEVGLMQLRAVDVSIQKLAKERLAELADQFFEIAQYYRPKQLPKLVEEINGATDGDDNGASNSARILSPYLTERLEQFRIWGKLAMECYGRATPYESPSLRAVVVAQPKTEDNKLRSADELFSEILQEMMERGIVPQQPEMKLIKGVVDEEVER
jgi:hypothetical protein